MYQVLRKIQAFAGRRNGLLTKSIVISFVGALFSAFQFLALMLVLDALVTQDRSWNTLWYALGIMLISIIGKGATTYFSTNQQTETGYFMVADKRIHIGDRLRYIPMGYFNKNSLGNITAVVTTTLTDVENTAARCLVMILGGFLNTLALLLMLTGADWRIGLIALTGLLLYLIITELSQKHSAKVSPARQTAQ